MDKRGELVGTSWNTTGEAPGTITLRVRATNSGGSVLSNAVTATLAEASATFPQLVRNAGTGWAIEIISDDAGGDLTFSATINGTTFGPFVRTAAQQISGAAVNHVLPSIAETTPAGTYAVDVGLWTHGLDPAPVPTFQWRRNGVAISGAIDPFYSEVIADAGTTITCAMTVAGVTAVSNGIAIEGELPVNLEPPVITGLLGQGSELTFDVGLWTGATSFEIEVTQTSPTATLLARQAVTGTTTGTVASAVGGTLTLTVWATGPGGVTQLASAPFGPIEAVGDQWVIGLVLNENAGFDPTPSGAPVTYTRLGTGAEAGMAYSAGQGWGWVGSNIASANDFSGQTRADVRLQQRYSLNLTPGVAGIRVDLPGGPGVYIIHAGFGAGTGVVPNMDVRDGGGSTDPIIGSVNAAGNSTGSAGNTMDAAGNVATHALWTSASIYGGQPIEVTATGSSLWFGRFASGGAMNLNYIGILKKAV